MGFFAEQRLDACRRRSPRRPDRPGRSTGTRRRATARGCPRRWCVAGTAVTRQPASTRQRRMLRLAPKSMATTCRLAALLDGVRAGGDQLLGIERHLPRAAALGELVALLRRDARDEVEPFHLRCGLGAVDQRVRIFRADAAVLCAAVADEAREPARVHAGDGHDAVLCQVVVQALLGAPAGRRGTQRAYHEAGHARLAVDAFRIARR